LREISEVYYYLNNIKSKNSQLEQEEIEVIKRIKTTTQVHQNCIIIPFKHRIVCEDYEKLTHLNFKKNHNSSNIRPNSSSGMKTQSEKDVTDVRGKR